MKDMEKVDNDMKDMEKVDNDMKDMDGIVGYEGEEMDGITKIKEIRKMDESI
jgi:hypothetical protein